MSDSVRSGRLRHAASSELNALDDAGDGEPVEVSTLDVESRAGDWPAVDFLKIDVEGEEERVLAGAKRLLAEHEPLLMFEVKVGERTNEHLRELVIGLGYRLFRLLNGAPLLVPLGAREPLDPYELNLFAAKPPTVDRLKERGLLVTTVAAWNPTSADAGRGLSFAQRQAYATAFPFLPALRTCEPEVGTALAAYATWRTEGESLPNRVGALVHADATLRALCSRAPSPARLSTLARVSWELGRRAQSVAALQTLLRTLRQPGMRLTEPFLPASARFDAVTPGGEGGNWFTAAAAEQLERTGAFSSCFSGRTPIIEWLCGQRYRTAELMRRNALTLAREGRRPRVPSELGSASADHLNAAVWREGLVPGTIV